MGGEARLSNFFLGVWFIIFFLLSRWAWFEGDRGGEGGSLFLCHQLRECSCDRDVSLLPVERTRRERRRDQEKEEREGQERDREIERRGRVA